MYLLVMVMFVVSLIGLYAQVLSVQVSRIDRAQVGMMQTLVSWHQAASNFAMMNLTAPPPPVYSEITLNATTDVTTTGCLLTYPAVGTGYGFGNCSADVSAPSTYLPRPNGSTHIHPFPAGFYNGTLGAFSGLKFYSLLYKDASGTAYVLTFVPKPTTATGTVYVPEASNGTDTGYMMKDLVGQFARRAPQNLTYGIVTAATPPTLIPATMAQVNGATVTYTLPSGVPAGALALLSVVQ